MAAALKDIRVLDLSRVLAGPWATQILADLGAQVIKIERPGNGDDTRTWGPPFYNDDANSGVSAYFTATNHNKKSLAIDISSEQGQAIIRELVKKSDVFIENFLVGKLADYGLDYESIKKINPDIVYCSISGFGQTGPYAHRAGYDLLIQGMSGLMSVTGHGDDQPGGEPLKVGVALTDIMTGLHAAIGILAALFKREKTQLGSYLDIALMDVSLHSMANQAMNYLVGDKVPQRLGNSHPNIVPYQTFKASDGHLIIAVGNDGQFAKLCDVLGHKEWSTDPRFCNNRVRVEHREVLVPLIADVLMTQTRQHWLEPLETKGVPSGPINTIDEVFADPQIIARGVKTKMHDAQSGVTINGMRLPIHAVDFSCDQYTAPPTLGQHSNEVLQELLGLDEAQLAKLHQDNIIA